MKLLVRLTRIAGLVSLCFALLAFAFLVIGPRTGGYRTLTVLTGSMKPAYPPGSVVVVVPIPIADVKVGDVITYKVPVDDRRIVTHRVIELPEPGVIRTKGDANAAPDAWSARLVGSSAWKVRAGIPGLGYALGALQQRAVRGASLVVTPLLLAFVWLRGIWRTDPLPMPVALPAAVTPVGAWRRRPSLGDVVLIAWAAGCGVAWMRNGRIGHRSRRGTPRHA